MNTTIPLPSTRYLALIGVAALAAVFFLVARPVLLGGDDGSVTTPPAPPAATSPQPPASKPSTQVPKVTLLPGLPSKVAAKLRNSRVVVVSLYQGNARLDRPAVSAAGMGAKAVGAGFLPVNVLNEKAAQSVQAFVGTVSTPAVVVVKRPGRIVATLEGAASGDQQLVAQAARNAGARRR